MSMKEIQEIRSQISQLEAKRRDAAIRLERAALRHLGLSLGDRIMVADGDKEFECVVTGVKGALYSQSGIIRPTATKLKKDGKVGAQSAGYIKNWRKKDAGE